MRHKEYDVTFHITQSTTTSIFLLFLSPNTITLMEPSRCHHCGTIGHKKFDCTERCKVWCNWCGNPPARRPPAVGKSGQEVPQRQGSGNGRNIINVSGKLWLILASILLNFRMINDVNLNVSVMDFFFHPLCL